MKSVFKCPICDVSMEVQPGTRIDSKDGITLYCDNQGCPTHENVAGHGSTEAAAHSIACQKYKKI